MFAYGAQPASHTLQYEQHKSQKLTRIIGQVYVDLICCRLVFNTDCFWRYKEKKLTLKILGDNVHHQRYYTCLIVNSISRCGRRHYSVKFFIP